MAKIIQGDGEPIEGSEPTEQDIIDALSVFSTSLQKALLAVEDAYVPVEIIMLSMLLKERLDPFDAIIAAYLIGKGDFYGDANQVPVVRQADCHG